MRCQHVGKRGQCNQPPIDGSLNCRRHTREKDRLRGYILNDTDLQERFDYHSRRDLIASLRDEMRLLKAMVEQRLNLARTDADKIACFSNVTPAITAIEKLANTIVKIERASDQVLEKDALRKLAEGIIQVLTEELGDLDERDAVVDRVARKIANLVADAQNSRD